jgi:hypothetical protein
MTPEMAENQKSTAQATLLRNEINNDNPQSGALR